MPPALIHPTYVRLLRVLLRRLGTDADALLQAAGIDPERLARDASPLELESTSRLARAAVQVTGRPWLGLELGASIEPSSHGALGLAVITSPDVRTGVRTIARHAPTRGSMLRWHLHEHDGAARLSAQESQPLGDVRGFILDVVYGCMLRALLAVAGSTEGLKVALPGPRPAWWQQYRAMADAELGFEAPCFSLHFPRSLLDAPGLASDAAAHAAALRECEAALAAQLDEALTATVQRRLAALGEGPWPTLEQVAAEVGVSGRTLIRRLRGEGSSFQQLLDAARQERALWYLRNTDATVEHIAHVLGYEDASNFGRTCRRWFGEVPSRLRRPLPP